MTKYRLASATALAMISSAGYAQVDSTVSPQSPPTATVPSTGGYSSSKTRKTVDEDGNVTTRTHTYNTNADGTTTSSNVHAKTSDDGQVKTYHEQTTTTRQ